MAIDSATPDAPGRRARLIVTSVLIIAAIIIAVLFIRIEQRRRQVSRELEQTSQELEQLKNSTQGGGQELAQKILAEVRLLMDIPEQPSPTVATIIDVEKLRQANSFYRKAENGDHLLIIQVDPGRGRAILYDPDTKRILDVLPVRLNTATPVPSPVVSPPPPATTVPTASAPPPPLP